MALHQKHYHAIQFYPDGESLARTVADFLIRGLRIGEPAIVIATPAHTSMVCRELTEHGFDAEELRRTGELHTFDARKMLAAFMVDGMPDPLLFRSNAGDIIERLCAGRKPCPVRAYGEMVDVLWQEGNSKGAIRLEILWNQLASTYDFKLLCGYAVGHFYKEARSPAYDEVCEQHSHVIGAL
jgi:MEDS: MEthanogen/methylotroph, DcmR Sensory domain